MFLKNALWLQQSSCTQVVLIVPFNINDLHGTNSEYYLLTKSVQNKIQALLDILG